MEQSNNAISFAEAILRRLKGKMVEVYSGDNAVTRQYSDSTVTMKEVIRGIVVDAEGELLVLKVASDTTENLAYVNAWNVRSIIEPKHGLSIIDMYSGEFERVRK